MVKADRVRKEHLDALERAGFQIPYKYETTHKLRELEEQFGSYVDESRREFRIKPGEITDVNVSVAGNVAELRDHGKVSFVDIYDMDGTTQVMFRPNELGDRYSVLKGNLDRGDIVGVNGLVMRTKKEELSVLAKDVTLLAKCLLDIPPLREADSLDVETRYRYRELDLKLNRATRETLAKRVKTIRAMQKYLDEKDFFEVEIPLIQPVYGGASAKPFMTTVNALDETHYLSISPELYLKRLIVGGLPGAFTITKNFRNESIDTTHNPEFTMMECYWANRDLYDMMRLTEEMLGHIALEVNKTHEVALSRFAADGTEEKLPISFAPPFKKMTMEDAVKEIAQIEVPDNESALRSILEMERATEKEEDDKIEAKYEDKESNRKKIEEEKKAVPRVKLTGDRLNRPNLIMGLFEKYVEGRLVQPTFIYDYPEDNSPLTRKHRSKPGWVERFELFVAGTELANAYSELRDPFDQANRFQQQEEDRKKGDEEAHPYDKGYVRSLMWGLPPTGGLGIGIDRLVMFLAGKASIKDVMLYPMMKRVAEED